jgi:RHS repeat-associated protein
MVLTGRSTPPITPPHSLPATTPIAIATTAARVAPWPVPPTTQVPQASNQGAGTIVPPVGAGRAEPPCKENRATNTAGCGKPFPLPQCSRAAKTHSWYTADALGSVQLISSNSGIASASANYDPYGGLQGSAIGSFGFTGELQQGSNVYLRARWYNAGAGSFGSRDPFAGYPEQPYSQHYFQYGYANPVSNADPSGRVVQASAAHVTYATSPGAAAVSPLRLPAELDCSEAAQDSITLEFDDLGLIIGSAIEYSLAGSSVPIAIENVYDLLSFSKANFRVAGYYQLVPGAEQTHGNAGPTTNLVGVGSGLYFGGFTGLSKYPRWSVENYAGKSDFVSVSVQTPYDILSADVTAFWSQDRNLQGTVVGLSFGISIIPYIASVKSGATNSIFLPGTLRTFRQANREWPDWWDGQDLLRSLEREPDSGALLPMRARAVVHHNAFEWERLEEWQKAHPGQVWKQ